MLELREALFSLSAAEKGTHGKQQPKSEPFWTVASVHHAKPLKESEIHRHRDGVLLQVDQ